MIYLPDVALTLEQYLNNSFNNQVEENPTSFLFEVQTVGFHLDRNYDEKDKKRNFIPVFIDALGGNYDAVKHVKRAIKNITVTFFFPVRFKNDFFAMDDFFVDNFVAEIVDFGGVTGKCLCNISVPQFGELQNLDLQQFKKWANEQYSLPIETMGVYMSMTFTIYLTTQSNDFILGNAIKYTLQFSLDKKARTTLVINLLPFTRFANLDKFINGQQYYAFTNNINTYYTKNIYFDENEPYYSIVNNVVTKEGEGAGLGETTETFVYNEDLVWTSSGTGASNSPISQQLIDVDDYAKNVINITNYNKSIVAYIRDNFFWDTLLDYYNNQKINDLYNVKLFKYYKFNSRTKVYTFNQVALSLNENVALGELISFTITFGDEYKEE